MDQRTSHYVEISGRIASGKRFCEFLASGGKVMQQPDEADWRDVTSEVMERERVRLGELERVRSLLYPDLAKEDLCPPFSTQ